MYIWYNQCRVARFPSYSINKSLAGLLLHHPWCIMSLSQSQRAILLPLTWPPGGWIGYTICVTSISKQKPDVCLRKLKLTSEAQSQSSSMNIHQIYTEMQCMSELIIPFPYSWYFYRKDFLASWNSLWNLTKKIENSKNSWTFVYIPAK